MLATDPLALPSRQSPQDTITEKVSLHAENTLVSLADVGPSLGSLLKLINRFRSFCKDKSELGQVCFVLTPLHLFWFHSHVLIKRRYLGV